MVDKKAGLNASTIKKRMNCIKTVASISFLSLAVTLMLAIPAEGQKRSVRQPVGRTASVKPADHEASVARAEPSPPGKSDFLGAAYQSGELPLAAQIPVGDVDTQAASLSQAIAAGDGNSTASLIAAIKLAGYGVRDKSGNVDYEHHNVNLCS